VVVVPSGWKSTAWGSGWSWDDYDEDYMPERSPLPVYGNVLEWHQESDSTPHEQVPASLPAVSIYSIPEVNWKVRFEENGPKNQFSVTRLLHSNEFHIKEGKEKVKTVEVPFITNGAEAAVAFLKDSFPMGIRLSEPTDKEPINYLPFLTRALDSVLQPMMHRSDNFFAEQLLLLVSEKILGVMDVDLVIDSLLRADLSSLPQRPRWADGSGLSRYNLFTPNDILTILNKTQKEFGMERVKTLFPTGGEGTLSNLYLTEKDRIYAKTNKKKWILFSIMINQHRGNAASIRKKIAAFITDVQNKL
jgi:D-alanyl-D-alanine carboxypeptidase/D-alanyl-D-alanine-endopeptidase (penicillin-binding protein 4)